MLKFRKRKWEISCFLKRKKKEGEEEEERQKWRTVEYRKEKKLKGKNYIIDSKENFIILQILEVLLKFKNMLRYEEVLWTIIKLLKSENNH